MGAFGKGMAGVLAIAGSVAIWKVGSTPAWAQDETAIELPRVDVSTRLLRAPNRRPSRSGAPASAPRAPAGGKRAPAAAPPAPVLPSGEAAAAPGGIVTGTIITGASSTSVTATDIA